MKYRGVEIGRVPTIAVIQDFISRKGMPLSAEEIYKHYEAMGWQTKKHKPIKSVEGIVNAMNGLRVYREMQERKKQEKKLAKQAKRQKSVIVLKNDSDVAHYKYSEQLKDKRWYAFREFVFVVRGKRCEKCGGKDCLQVHHLQYKRGRLAWEYTVNDVMVVCGDCHKKIHGL